jgi:fumarylacetoacetate (FAA) hydrolase
MRFATLHSGTPDGQLAIVSRDNMRFLPGPTATLQELLERWDEVRSMVTARAQRLDRGEGEPLDLALCLAPLPRAWQWLDASAFITHGRLMTEAFKLDPVATDPPLMYQGLSHRFLAPREDVVLRTQDYGLDFEGEFGVITDAVPMGVSAKDALAHIKLVVVINDWSQRAFTISEMKRGFGWLHAKPASSVAPVCLTPDELGEAWKEGRVCLPLHVTWNGEPFGRPNGGEMDVGFHDLIAYAAQTRDLPAGTIIGSGTVSNAAYAECGSACIAERRAIETIATGRAVTSFLAFGDVVRVEARSGGDDPLFGFIEQLIVPFSGQ